MRCRGSIPSPRLHFTDIFGGTKQPDGTRCNEHLDAVLEFQEAVVCTADALLG